MTTYCGFDLELVADLKKAIADSATDALGLSPKVGSTYDEAERYVMLAGGVAPQIIRAEGSTSTDSSPDRSGMRPLIMDAQDLASEIGRRLEHLKGCKAIEAAGYVVDHATVFDDTPPPDLTKITGALAAIRANVGDQHFVKEGAQPSYDALMGLNAAEAEAVVGSLSDDDLENLNAALNLWTSLDDFFDSGFGMPNDKRIELSNKMFPGLSKDQMKRFCAGMPVLEPNFSGTEGKNNDDQKDLHWVWQDGELVHAFASPSDLNQGDLGDCWFLASLGAEVRADPDFVSNHVKDNGNGTYSVTLFKDGKQQIVTVDSQLPTNSWKSTPFEHGDDTSGTWVQIYEKAYAQLNGGYKNIEGGYGDKGMSDLTGKHSTKHGADDISFKDLYNDYYDKQKPITVGSDSHHSGFLWHNNDETFPNTDVITKHEYVVENIDPDKGTITLRNPWGSGAAVGDNSIDEQITLTEDQFHDMFDEVSIGDDG